jgi:anti-sigma-K factor RskA
MSARERTIELLADRALEGLAPEERVELERLLAENPDLDDDSFELAAASVALAAADDARLPERLRTRVASDAGTFFGSAVAPFPARTPWLQSAGWYAAAACLALAAVVWWMRPDQPVPAPSPTLAQLREHLLASPGTVHIDWTPTKDPDAAGVKGDVVWNAATQTGYMRFRGLPANDASHRQYQLWIFDASQDERYPVDGGVFDVPPTAGAADDVVIPIHAKLNIVNPTLFAVTEEKPGGVVVSSRERLVLVAKT